MNFREIADTDMNSNRRLIGQSTQGRAIIAHEFVNTGMTSMTSCIFVLGGTHGDEPKSVYVVEQLMKELPIQLEQNSKGLQHRNARSILWVLVPIVNPDGFERRTRRNARKVDLNRNFPTKNWELGNPRSRMFGGHRPASEPETKAMIKLTDRVRPDVIVTIHSINQNRFCNNYDGPGRKVAHLLAKYNKYPVTSTIGYPTPGSFGTWAGVERGIPTITLELPSHHSSKRCWEDNREALLRLGTQMSRR